MNSVLNPRKSEIIVGILFIIATAAQHLSLQVVMEN